jgi:hypothetical protein
MNSRTPTDRICPQRPSRRPGGGRIATLLVTSCLAWSGMALPLGAARAQSGLPDNSADTGFAALKARANIQAAQRAVAAQPNDEAAVRNLIEALARGGRNADALAEADRFVSRGTATAALRTQRGFLRRQLGDLPGAVEDFTAALKGPGLSADQRATVQAGLAEAQAAQSQGGLDRAQADLARGDFAGAATAARLILESNPGSESAMRIRVEALTAAGRTREALAEAEKFAGRAGANPLLRPQRGFLRRGFDDPHGAAEDFAAALAGDGLTAEQRRNLEAGLAEAKVAEAQTELDRADAALSRGDLQGALAASRKALERDAGSEAATRIRVEALSRLGRKRDAATEADGFIARNAASALMRAQREFIRRELNDTAGAIEDFSSALAGDGLSPEQKRNVQAALAEARSAGQQGSPAPAAAAQPRPKTEAETQADENRLLAEGTAPGWLYAKRGNARFDAHDYRGAVADFDRALARGDLDRSSVPGIR